MGSDKSYEEERQSRLKKDRRQSKMFLLTLALTTTSTVTRTTAYAYQILVTGM